MNDAGTPSGTTKFDGSFTAFPLTVTILSVSGLPVLNASPILYTVSILNTIAPTSAGSPPVGTFLPVIAFMSIFSAPCGYLGFNGIIFMLSSYLSAFFNASIHSRLFVSMPI